MYYFACFIPGASTDGEEADLSDAMKESPTSPFESEPEMVTSRDAIFSSRGVTPHGDACAPQEEELTPQGDMVTSSEIRYPSSSGLTESEPEMIPSPPPGVMTTSQVSTVSQR